MRISEMKTNHITDPLGFELSPVTFSWKVAETPSAAAVSSRVEVAGDEAFTGLIHDSGPDADISCIAYSPPDLELAPRTRYWWRVTVIGDNGDEATSSPAFFETGKMTEPWTASWISSPFEKDVHPCFRKSFSLKGDIVSARAYACGLGVYELFVNGVKAGDEYLAPGLHSYESWLQTQTYDLTNLLVPGANAIGAMLGNGWAKGHFGPFDMEEVFCGEFAFIAEIHVDYAHGGHEIINSCNSWLCAPSPVLESSIYDGETYDAQKEQPGWSLPDMARFDEEAATGEPPEWELPVGEQHGCGGSCFDPSGWEQAVESVDYQQKWGLGALCDRLSLPVRSMLEIKPAALIRTPSGEDVLDMGQNMVGRLSFFSRGKKGTNLTLSFGEILQDGNFYRDNLRTAKAEYHYICGGRPSQVSQLFTFYGFRYVRLEGFEDIDINDFTGVVLYSDMHRTGSIETSDEKVNRLFQNVLWGQRGNFLDVPTDCPQRDERLGWTGDAQIFCETASWNMDVYAFFTKYLRDMAYGQTACAGAVPHIIPDIYPRRGGRSLGSAACGWADAATVIPWTLYLTYGDDAVLRFAFPVMRKWVDWISAEDERSGARRLWTTGFHFGDWLAMDAPAPGGVFGATDVGFLASAYYYYSAHLTGKAAEVLGDADNAKKYFRLADEVKAAIRAEYFTPGGRIAVKTQTAMAVALDFGLCPDGCLERLTESLKMQLVSDGMKLKTGFLGTPALCSVLSENNAHPYALRLFFNEEMPGWLYPVNMGATTIWERWDSVLPDGRISDTGMNSLNHYAYGSVANWMYRYLCGIVPLAPGFARVRFEPRPCRQLEFARASFDSPFGMIQCGWERLPGGELEIRCAVPFGVTGELVFPGAVLGEIRRLLPEARDVYEAGGKVAAGVSAGLYSVRYTPAPPERFGLDTPVYELLANEQAGALLSSVPALKVLPDNLLGYSFGDLLDYIEDRFVQFLEGAKAIAGAVLSIDRD